MKNVELPLWCYSIAEIWNVSNRDCILTHGPLYALSGYQINATFHIFQKCLTIYTVAVTGLWHGGWFTVDIMILHYQVI